MTWLPIFDDSFQRVPAAHYPAMYADGYRVMAGYVAGGSASKWVTEAEIRAWLAAGPDAGFLPLFEAVGNEPVSSPDSGAAHARSARAGARARGVPDSATISPAMDRDVTMTQAQGPIAAYMRAWKAADTTPPLPYIELDAGAWLYAAGLTVGTGTPAAYGWDPSNRLATPANAPTHVLWTQEHNGISLNGGSIDIGHILASAPIWWSDDMALSADDGKTVWSTDVIPNTAADAKANPTTAAAYALGDVRSRLITMGVELDAVKAQAAASGGALTTLMAKVAALPTTTLPAGPMTDADVDRIAVAVVDLLAKREAS